MKILRTDEARFSNLPDYPFEPHYCQVGKDLRMHYVDEGKGETILCLHGEPSWSFLYRKMIPVFVREGYRAAAPDLIGFGRSDKPADQSDYTYQRHVDWVLSFLRETGLKDLTLVGQDWGGLIGLRVAASRPDLFSRLVVANTGLPEGTGASEAFRAWLNFSQTVPVLPVGEIVKQGTSKGFDDDVQAAYDAPFPDESYKAGARRFPALVPIEADQAGVEENRKAWEVLRRFEKPCLTAFSDSDPVTKGGEVFFQKRVPGAKGVKHTTIKNAGHFLQEDAGEVFAETIVSFMRAHPA